MATLATTPMGHHDRISQYGDNGNPQHISEEPALHSLHKPLDEDSAGGRDDNVSELEKDLLLAFEEQEKSSVSPPISARPRRSVESSRPQIDQIHDQGGTSHSRLEELGYRSPLGQEEPQEQQQQQEIGVGPMRDEDHNVENPRPARRRKWPDQPFPYMFDVLALSNIKSWKAMLGLGFKESSTTPPPVHVNVMYYLNLHCLHGKVIWDDVEQEGTMLRADQSR